MATVAPCCANSVAVARPMPRLLAAPEITATLSASSTVYPPLASLQRRLPEPCAGRQARNLHQSVNPAHHSLWPPTCHFLRSAPSKPSPAPARFAPPHPI